jgi:hypothetical protein
VAIDRGTKALDALVRGVDNEERLNKTSEEATRKNYSGCCFHSQHHIRRTNDEVTGFES